MTSSADLNWIVNYIWGIADDVLRDLYVRGKYRDVILPMTVLRRLDAVLEDTKQAVLDMKALLDKAGVVEQKTALRAAAGQAFHVGREPVEPGPEVGLQPLPAGPGAQVPQRELRGVVEGRWPVEAAVQSRHPCLRAMASCQPCGDGMRIGGSGRRP
jgi:hypothetical protein